VGKLLGHIHFDSGSGKSDLSELLAVRERADAVFRNKYVHMRNDDNNSSFLGRIVEGPFFIPEEVGRDSAFAQTAILRGEEFKTIPNYYTMARVEVLGEERDNQVFGTNTRPRPKSKVEDLTTEEVQKVIGISGDITLGTLAGYPEVKVLLDSKVKKVVPRNIGIFGTVGAGKTNTSQVLIEELSRAGYAVIVFDVEGEYVEMDSASTEEHLHQNLRTFDRQAEGLKKFQVFHPCGSEQARKDSTEFDIPFAGLSPYLISELADLTEPQEGLFLKIVEKLKEEQRRKGKSSHHASKSKSAAIAFLEGDDVESNHGYTIGEILTRIPEEEKVPDGTKWPLERKLKSLQRTGIFDQGKGFIEANAMLKSGLVSIIDVSGVSHDGAKNLSIAYILRQIFNEKLTNPEAPRTMVVIEEAHTFVSKESRSKMTATMDMLKLIARRGRKRWLALSFISQQPSHLPDEILELCNTRIIHSIKSDFNLNPVKKTSGDVINELWDLVPGFGPGQALISSPQFGHTIMVNMRPCATKRRMSD
jgi:DNA helicase HerA-like ATPase